MEIQFNYTFVVDEPECSEEYVICVCVHAQAFGTVYVFEVCAWEHVFEEHMYDAQRFCFQVKCSMILPIGFYYSDGRCISLCSDLIFGDTADRFFSLWRALICFIRLLEHIEL